MNFGEETRAPAMERGADLGARQTLELIRTDARLLIRDEERT